MKRDKILMFSLKTVHRVMYSGGFINLILSSNTEYSKLDIGQRKFSKRLINGTVENWLYLNYIINTISNNPNRIKKDIRVLLSLALYNLIFLDRKSDAVIVNRYVEFAKKEYPHVKGFVNYVLRSYLRNPIEIKRDMFKNDIDYLSVKYSHSTWLVQELVLQYGLDYAKEILHYNNKIGKMYLRVNTKYFSRKEVIEYLISENAEVLASPHHLDAIELLNSPVAIEELEAFKMGMIYIQDISSMYVTDLLCPDKSDKILDLCSAPAGKSTHMAQRLDSKGKLLACDIHGHKLNLIQQNSSRMRLEFSVKLNDASVLNTDFINKFDKVLVDAPCSGWGVIPSKPEIKYRTNKKDVKKLIEIQKNILENASKYINENGVLVYSTCTINKKENIEVINCFLDKNREFKIDTDFLNNDDFRCGNLNEVLKSGIIALNQSNGFSSGFFACRLIRKK